MTAFVGEWLINKDKPIFTNPLGTIPGTTGRGSPDYFWRKPVPPGILERESWERWCRWYVAYWDGETDLSTHPALPADRGRRQVLEAILHPLSQFSQAEMKRVGETRRAPNAMETRGGFHPFEIRWGLRPAPPDYDEK